MTEFKWIYFGGATLVGYTVIIAMIIFTMILCAGSDKLAEKIKLPQWINIVGRIIFYLLMIIFSIIFAYGMGDIVIQRFMI